MGNIESINGRTPESSDALRLEKAMHEKEKVCVHMEAELSQISKEVELVKNLTAFERTIQGRSIEETNAALEKENEILKGISRRLQELNEKLKNESV